jgi:hypothetical protein
VKPILYFVFLSCITVYALDFCANDSRGNSAVVNDKAKSLVDEWQREVKIVMGEMIPVSHFRIYREDLESYNRMIGCGVEIIPHILELAKEAFKIDSPSLEKVLYFQVFRDLTHKMFEKGAHEDLDRERFKHLFQRYVNWWEHGYKEDSNKFDVLYEEYKKTKEPSVITEIQTIGIRILPQVINKIEEGDTFLIPLVEHLTSNYKEKKISITKRSDLTQEEKVALVKEWWKMNKTRYSMDYEK